MIEVRKTDAFEAWFDALRDREARLRIQVRIDRLAFGNPGQHRPLPVACANSRSIMAPATGCTTRSAAACWSSCFAAARSTASSAISARPARWPANWIPDMPLKTTPYDSAAYLRTEEDRAAYLAACMEEAPEDASFIAHALGIVARSRNMSQLARDT